MNISGNTILITGATSGIGRGLAEAFHARDNRVIILGRRQDRLDDITAAHSGMRGIALDVRDPAAIEALARRLRDEEPGLNVLINNAGISRQQRLTPGETDLSVTRDIVETNIMSVVHATAAFLPQLAAQSRSTIITTTSAGIRAARQFSELLREQGISAFLASIAARPDARVLCRSARACSTLCSNRACRGPSAH